MQMSDSELLEAIERMAKAKCQTYNISFGIFKAMRGPIDYTSIVVMKDNHGNNSTKSISADSMSDLLCEVYKHFETIK